MSLDNNPKDNFIKCCTDMEKVMSIRKIAEVADAVLIPVIINLSILQILNGDTYEKNNRSNAVVG